MNFNKKMIDQLKLAQHVVVFTGAGVSQESGIPTFRDAMTGIWEKFDAESLATPEAFLNDRDFVWGWYEWRRAMVLRCRPNPAHLSIAAMAAAFPRLTLITQNVDDLHERAGSKDVIHLHGSLHHPRCFTCGDSYVFSSSVSDEFSDGGRLTPPQCASCGGWVRPGVVWFGEQLPMDSLAQAVASVKTCDIFFSIGTSSLVYPAALLPFEAAERGACVIQVNPDATQLDSVATYNLKGRAGEVMGALYKELAESYSHHLPRSMNY